MKRGEIWWASLSDPEGSAPGYRRPVLIIQANEFNESRINTLIAAVITSNVALATAPGNKILKARTSGLTRVSVVNVSQIITIDKRRLTEKVKRLDDGVLEEVEEGLRLVLGL
jgi:mRNA interferase MazF